MSDRIRSLCLAALLGAGACTAACGKDAAVEITDVRERPQAGTPAPRTTTEQRMRGELPGGAPHGGMPGADAGGSAMSWSAKAPAGWAPMAAPQFTSLAWRVAGDAEAMCTFSASPRGGAGLADNVNRWRKQMSLPPVDAAAVDALPKRGTMLGREATFLELAGTYVGRGEKNVADAKMLTLITELPAATAILKFVGPAKVVDAEAAHLLELAATITMDGGGAGHGGEPAAAGPGPGMPPEPRASAPFTWTAPSAWVERPAKAMRVVTYAPAAAKATEVYVATAGGAIKDNVNRWRGQMGLTPLSDEAYAALPRGKVLGGTGVYLVAEGTFGGMAGGEGKAGWMLLGMAVERPGTSVFVKMVGPADEVRGEQDRFRAFCESLHE
jgi:hypothetical protein